METYRQITEHIAPKSGKKQFYFSSAIGIVYMALGVVNYNKNNEDIWTAAIWFLGGLGFIIMASIQQNRNGKYFVEFNDNGIDANLSAFKSINIKWNEIKEIEVKPLNIIFKLEADSKEELSLSVWSYASVIKIKAKLKEFASKNEIKLI